jgi:prepilin-type N-terminal cleavage/methylation domain-containing protein
MKIMKINKPAFTLIEILIALAIFSFALVIVTGIFSSILGNQTLISTSSEVSRENQRIMRQISDDVISATKTGRVVRPNGSSTPAEGFLFLDGDMRIIDASRLCHDYPGSSTDELEGPEPTTFCTLARGLVLFSDEGIKIYRYRAFSGSEFGDIEHASVLGSSDLNVSNAGYLNMTLPFRRLNSPDTEVKKLRFWGFGCYADDCSLHPFVQVYFALQTKDYDKLSVNKRFIFGLKTTISKRTYN